MKSVIDDLHVSRIRIGWAGARSVGENSCSETEAVLVDDAFIDSGTSPPELQPTRMGLLDYSRAAQYLGITERHLKRLREYGQIEYVKVGRLVRFRPGALDEYIEAHAVQVAYPPSKSA